MRILRLCLLGLMMLGAAPALAASSDENAASVAPLFDAAMSRGDVLLAAGENSGAENQYRIALQQGPVGEARADALHKLGIALAQQSRFSEAQPLVAEAEKLPGPGGAACCWRMCCAQKHSFSTGPAGWMR
ncbi:MAG: hypothetical protein ACPGRZ_16360, partial [Alphaproteobacteria bacterium]